MEDSLYYIIIDRIKDECGFNKDECNDLMWAFMIDFISLIVENNEKTIEFKKLPLYKKSPKRVLKAFKIFKEECRKDDFFNAIMPINPVAHKFDDGVFTTSFPYTCKCGAELKDKQNRCTECGQIIDWSDFIDL